MTKYNIQSWARGTIFASHSNKTKELIIFRRRSKSVTYPAEPLIPVAERVTSLRVWEGVISSRLTMGEHLDQLISSCASSIFALRTLRAHGLPPPHHTMLQERQQSLRYCTPPRPGGASLLWRTGLVWRGYWED